MSVLPEVQQIKQEFKWLAASFVILSVILMIAFQKSNIGQVIRTATSLYWMFVLPGYALALCSRQGFVERFIIGVTVQTAILGLVSYYAGLAGWPVATHGFVLPLFSILVGIGLWWKTT